MIQLTVVLHNIRSTYNVGAILRTAEGLGAEKVVFSGYTPRYDDQQLLPHLRAKLNRQIEKSALGAERLVPSETVEDLASWLTGQKRQGGLVVGLENNLSPEEIKRRIVLSSHVGTSVTSSDTASLQPVVTGETHLSLLVRPGRSSEVTEVPTPPSNIILILGEEVEGIPAEIREKCDYFLEIPMRGKKESFNVSVAAGIAMWELIG